MLKDLKPPMNPKETSLTTHPEASTKMYGINNPKSVFLFITTYLGLYFYGGEG